MYSDTLIIGAGAAGLAAARKLHDAGLSVTVLEARERIGGRCWTSYDYGTTPIELGAEFVHGENVVTWQLMQAHGMGAILHDGFRSLLYSGGQLRDSDSEPLFYELRPRIFALAQEHQAAGRPDTSVAAAFRAHPERFPELFASDEAWRLWGNAIAVLMVADLDDLGLLGRLEAAYDGDGALNFRLTDGYSALWQRYAAGLDIRLNTPVSRVTWGEDGVTVEAAGAEYAAERAVVTLPLGVLKAGDVAFDPPLPTEKQAAIAGLGAGQLAKIVYEFEEAFWPDDLGFLFTPFDTQLWWTPAWGAPEPAPVLTNFVGGRMARKAAALGADAPFAALRDLETVFSMPLERRLTREPLSVFWGSDPYSKLGYSYRPPGAKGLMAQLAAPVGNRLFFAGEATHSTKPVAVHGALMTGWRAADEVVHSS